MSDVTRNLGFNIFRFFTIVALLLVVDMFVFNGGMNRITFHYLLYWIDFRHWPISIGVAIWLLFFWLLVDNIQFRKKSVPDTACLTNTTKPVTGNIRTIYIKRALLIGCGYFMVTTLVSIDVLWLWFYFSVLIPWYFEPMTMFFYDGTLTGRLFFPPATAAAVIVFLLYINRIYKSGKNHER